MGKLNEKEPRSGISISAMIRHYEWMFEKKLIKFGGSAYKRMELLKSRFADGKRYYDKVNQNGEVNK